MYNQDDYIFEQFNNAFFTKKKDPIVLYGIGINTGKLLERIPDYNIVGLMDGKQKNGVVWNKKIIDEKDVLDFNVKTIVIVARPAVIGMIYHRIKDFADNNGINVFDIHGIDLSIKYKNRECDLPFYHLNMDDMLKACEGHNIVMFDIFDTLLVRKTLYPKDIFQIVERKLMNGEYVIVDFAIKRAEAEDILYKRGLNPNIYEIYNELQYIADVDKKTADMYLEVEIETEMQFISPRKTMLEFFNKIKNEKSIYFISDMYLTMDIIEKMLKKCGYTGYKDIYVSCEHNCAKTTGLFDVFLSNGYKKEECIHIGDNYVADGECARASGIATFEIMSMREMLENSAYNCVLDKSTGLLDNMIIGLFCCEAFDNPFVFFKNKGKLNLNNHKKIAYLCCAPIISYFCFWLMQGVIKNRCDYVLYPSRDAYIIEKMCNKILLNQMFDRYPEGMYFYTSRRAIFASTIFDRNDIEYNAKVEFHGNLRELFLERFNVDIKDECELNDSNIQRYIDKYEKTILDSCEEERCNYARYMENLLDRENIGLIDFVASGSIQNGLRKLLGDKNIQGFYFLKRNTDNYELEKCIKVESFYKPQGDFELDTNVYKFYLFLELLLTSSEPTFYSFDRQLNPAFMKEVRTSEHIKTVEEMQDEIINYCVTIAKLYPHLLNEEIHIDVPDAMIGFLGKEYSQVSCEEVLSLVLTDEYFSMKFNIFDR